MEKRDLLLAISKAYNQARLADDKIVKLESLVEKGTATYADVYELSDRAGKIIGDVMYQNLEDIWGTISFEDASEMIPYSLRYNHDYVAAVTEKIEKTINENAEIGLKPIKPEFDQQEARKVAEDAVSGASKNEFVKKCKTFSRKTVDDSIRVNAQVKERAGLEVRVTRRYDGIGVHRRKDECKWCMDRCGENMPYNEAYAKGAFERHPGCGCELLYMAGKSLQRQKDWTYNQWEDVENSDIINNRRAEGIKKPFSADQKMSQIDKYISAKSGDLLKKARNGGTHEGIYKQALEKAKPQLERSINSHIKAVYEHIEKLENPARYMHRDDPTDPVALNRAKSDWINHRRRNAEQAAIEIEVWRDRFE